MNFHVLNYVTTVFFKQKHNVITYIITLEMERIEHRWYAVDIKLSLSKEI